MASPTPTGSTRASPLLAFVRLVYLHVVLLGALFGVSATGTTTSRPRGGCPLSRLQVAFQAPFNTLSSALHGSTVSSLITQRFGKGGPSFANAVSPRSTAAPRWITDGTSASTSTRVLRSRKVDVLPLRMSVVETKQGKKRAAVDEPEPTETKAEKKARRVMASSKALGVHVIGLSHHNAGVDVREKLAVPEAEWNEASAKVCVFLCLMFCALCLGGCYFVGQVPSIIRW